MYQNKNFRGQNNRGGYRQNYRYENYERGRSSSRERWFSDSIRCNSNSRSRSGSRVSIKTEISVESMIILQKIVLQQRKRDRSNIADVQFR